MSNGEEQARGVVPLLEIEDDVTGPLHGLRVMVRDTLAPVSLALGILYLPLAAVHLLLLAPPVALPVAVSAAATAALLLGLHLVLARRPLPPRLAHAVGTGIVLLPLANGLLQLGLSRDIAQSTTLMLVILGAAYLLPAGPWFFVVLVAAVGGWAALIVIPPALPLPPQFAIAMAGAAGLGLAINRVRLLTLHRLELAMVAAIDREADMNRLFMLSRDMQCLAKLDGTVLRGNPSFIHLEGYREGWSLLDLVDERDRPAVATRLAAAGAGASAFEARLADGDRWVAWEAVPMPDRGIVHLSGRDITVRRRMEEQLRLSFVAMESAASGIMITDRAGVITWVNPAFTRLTGWGIADIEGRTPGVLASGTHPPEVYRELWTTIGAGLVWRGELVNRRRDGSLYTEEQTIAPVRDVDGEITHFVAVKNDVTERRRAEEVLRRDAGRMQRELALAEEVQAGLAPTAPPALEGWRLAATARPARGRDRLIGSELPRQLGPGCPGVGAEGRARGRGMASRGRSA